MESRPHSASIKNSNIKKQFYLFLPDLISILVLLTSGVVYIFGIGKFLDILGNDESMYLYWGIRFPKNFPNSEWAPLYILWYFFLNQFQSDSILLYFLNYILMTILPPLFIYLFLRINKVPIVISFFSSILFLLSFANFPTWPKVSHFALLLLLLGLIVVSLLIDKKLKGLAFTVCLLLTSFIRPEFFLSFLLMGIIMAILYLKEFKKKYTFESILPLISALSISLVLMFFLGLPAGRGSRSFDAFGQHYARNWVKWHNDPRDPYYNYIEILKEDFGNVNSIPKALIKNPSAIAKHVSENTSILLSELRHMFMFFYPQSYPNKEALFSAILVLILSLILFSGDVNRLNPKNFLNQISENFRCFSFLFFMVLIALAPIILSSIFIYPRSHYLLFPGVIIILMVILILFRKTSGFNKKHAYVSVAVICLFAVILVRPLNSLISNSKPENLITIKFLRSLKIKKPVNILETWGIYSIYLGKNFKRVPEYWKVNLFNEYLSLRSINMIILSDRLSNDTRFANDPEWVSFVKNPENWGFITINIPDVRGIKVLIKEELLKNEPKRLID